MATVFPTIKQQLSSNNYQPTTNNQQSNMTQSVDQTSITDVTSRRHNDPPGLWIAVVTSSVALHLLLFWLMRYSQGFTPWFPRASEAIIPIEVIEISPSSSKAKPQLKAKTVSLKPAANQQSSTLTTRDENSGGINFGASRKQRKRNTFVSKSNTQLVPKKSVPTPTPTPTSTTTDSLGNLGWKRDRERISLGKPTPLPKFTPVEPSQSIGENSPTPSRRTLRQPIGEDSQIPSRRTPRQPIGEDSPTPSRKTPRQPIAEDSPIPSRKTPRQPIAEDSPIPSRKTPRQPIAEDSQIPTTRKTPQPPTGGGLIAISRFLTPNELTPDEKRILRPDDRLPKGLIFPTHIGSNEKQIDSISFKPYLDLANKEFLVTLVIDKTGNFVQAVVEDPAIPEGERAKYQQFANSIFQGEKFQPARSSDGTPVPDFVNRFVRIKIQAR